MGYYLVGATCEIYDDNDGTGGHAVGQPHTPAELLAFLGVNFVDLGTTPKSWHSLVNLQGGRAPGTAITTILIGEDLIQFAAARGWLTHAASAPNVYYKFGTKVGAGNRASGKNGTKLRGGATHNISGNCEIYGCTLESETGTLNIGNAGGTSIVEMMNCIIQASTTIQVGFSTNIIAKLFNVDFINESAGASVVLNFFAAYAEKLTFTGTTPNGFMLWNAAVRPEIREASFFGTPTASDIRMSTPPGTPIHLVKHRWSGNAPRFPDTANFTISPDGEPGKAPGYEYGVMGLSVQRAGAGTPISGIKVRATDRLGLSIFSDVVSDAYGDVIFGDQDTIYANAVRVLEYYRDAAAALKYAWRDRSPITIEANYDNGNTTYLPTTKVIGWPQGADAYGPLLRDLNDVIELEPRFGGREDWRTGYA